MERPIKKARTKRRREVDADIGLESEETFQRFENDRLLLLRVFPEEVWLMIFKKEKKCETLQNWYIASPFLRFLLVPRRMEFLFFNVWNKVLGKLYLNNFHKRRIPASAILGGMEYDHFGSNERNAVPWYLDILKLRLVCKTWCDAVDHFYQNLENHESMHGPDLTGLKCTDGISSQNYNFYVDNQFRRTKNNPARFLSHFQNTHENGIRNPFITSNVRVSLTNQDSLKLWTSLEGLLTKYKVHVRHLTVDGRTNSNISLLTRHYSRLCQLLCQLTNLETLRITQTQKSNELHTFQQSVYTKPFPTITKKLKFLSIEHLPPAFYNQIMQQNCQIRVLELYTSNINKWQVSYLPNLTQLSMTIHTESELEYFLSNWMVMPLETLKLRFRKYIQWSKIFSLLENKWNKCVTDLLLELPPTTKDEELVHCYEFASLRPTLNLPTIQRLKLELRNVACLDFILPLKESLQELQIRANCLKKERYAPLLKFVQTQQEIQLVGFWDKLEYSNIWALFPELRLVKLFIGSGDKCYQYARGETSESVTD